ncbi:MAG: ferritin family protein [Chitinispirillaceae bacterium]|nr:ferritin family protein [Chitinispirillaceae bacterium]
MGAIQFNADEIFTMAEQIERNGARFYRAAAANIPAGKELLEGLAAMEDDHLATFEQMHTAVSAREAETVAADPDGEAHLYLTAMAGDHVFDTKKDPVSLLKGNETIQDILKIAIGLEKDSVVFYVGMKDFVSPKLGKDKIDRIINEEMKHIAILNRKLSE